MPHLTDYYYFCVINEPIMLGTLELKKWQNVDNLLYRMVWYGMVWYQINENKLFKEE